MFICQEVKRTENGKKYCFQECFASHSYDLYNHKSHIIAEELILETAINIVNIMACESAWKVSFKITFVQQRYQSGHMAQNLNDQLIDFCSFLIWNVNMRLRYLKNKVDYYLVQLWKLNLLF